MKVRHHHIYFTAEGGGATVSLILEPETFTVKPAATKNRQLKIGKRIND